MIPQQPDRASVPITLQQGKSLGDLEGTDTVVEGVRFWAGKYHLDLVVLGLTIGLN